MPLSRFPHDKQADALIRAYKLAGRDLTALIKQLTDGKTPTVTVIATAQLTLSRLGAATDTETRQLISDAVKEADARAKKLLPKRAPLKNPDLPIVQNDAATKLANDLLDGLTAAREGSLNDVRQIAHTITRREAALSLLGEPGRGSRPAVTDNLIKALKDKKITGFVDKAGRNWKVENYAEMLTRTITRQAVTEGAITRYAAHGVELIQVSSHATSCPICGPMQGKIMRIDGSTEPVDGVSVDALQLPPFHPNCRHVILPYIP